MNGRRYTRTATALLAAVCLSVGSAHALFDGLRKKALLGFEAKDLTNAAAFGNDRVKHDIAAAIDWGELEATGKRAYEWTYEKARREVRGVHLLDLGRRHALRRRWKALGVRATRVLLIRKLQAVAEGRVEPHRPYRDPRWKATALRDAYLGVKRRSNVRALLGGFKRYSGADQAKIDALEERIGKHRLEGILEQHSHEAGFEHVRQLAAFLAVRIRTWVEPSEVDFDRVRDETKAAVLRDLAAELDPSAEAEEDDSGWPLFDGIQAGLDSATSDPSTSGTVVGGSSGKSSGLFGTD